MFEVHELLALSMLLIYRLLIKKSIENADRNYDLYFSLFNKIF